jgi:hypothetical protein
MEQKRKTAEELEKYGYLPWNDHVGYTVDYLNRQLTKFGLEVKTETTITNNVFFKVVEKSKMPFEKAMLRPANFDLLLLADKWAIDAKLDILDWNGNCDHQENDMCPDCRRRWEERFNVQIKKVETKLPE